MMYGFIVWWIHRGEQWSAANRHNRAAVAPKIERHDRDPIAGPDSHAEFPLTGLEPAEDLHDLAVDFDFDETLALPVEVRHGLSGVEQSALQSACGCGGKAEEKGPKRREYPTMEDPGTDKGNAEEQRA